jgi:hypothetical protein
LVFGALTGARDSTVGNHWPARFRIGLISNMKTVLLATIALFALKTVALADYIIQERMEHNDLPPQNVTIKLKANKARCDIGTAMSMIADGGEITMLMHSQKAAMKMPIRAISKNQKDSPANPRPILQPTGHKEKISGFDTEEYLHDNSRLKSKTHFWIAKDFPDKAEIIKMLNAMQSPMTKQLMHAAGAVSPEDFPGLPIRTEIESNLMGKPSKTTVTITSIKKEPVDDSVFAVPGDYRTAGSEEND